MNNIINIIVNLLVSQVIPKISTELIDTIVDFAVDFQNRAKKTSNPWDDIAAAFLKALVENVINIRAGSK